MDPPHETPTSFTCFPLAAGRARENVSLQILAHLRPPKPGCYCRQRALEALVTKQTLTVEERKHSLTKVVRHDELSLVGREGD